MELLYSTIERAIEGARYTWKWEGRPSHMAIVVLPVEGGKYYEVGTWPDMMVHELPEGAEILRP